MCQESAVMPLIRHNASQTGSVDLDFELIRVEIKDVCSHKCHVFTYLHAVDTPSCKIRSPPYWPRQ